MNVYIWTDQKPELVLQKVLDFTTNSWWNFTMTPTQWNWATINTSWWYCEWASADSYGNTWNAVIWKRINAKRFWGRVKFMHPNSRHWWVILWVRNISATNVAQGCDDYADQNIIEIIPTSGSIVATWTVSLSANTQYYLDVKFDNWLYSCTLSDSNLNPLKTISAQTQDTIWYYSGFGWRWWVSQKTTWRVYEYREAYDNN